jgi:hypothetical protein
MCQTSLRGQFLLTPLPPPRPHPHTGCVTILCLFTFPLQQLCRHTLCRHCDRKSLNVSDQPEGSARPGGGSLLIMKMTRSGCTFQRGGVISAISMAEIPSAHTSTCGQHSDGG